MRLDEILEALPDVGLRLRNLFQLADGWQANVSSADENTAFQFGRGATPVEAMVNCLKLSGVVVSDQ